MGIRRKVTDSDLNTLRQDLPRLALILIPLAWLAVYHPRGGGYRPTEGKYTGDLRHAGRAVEAFSAEVTKYLASADASWTKFFNDLDDIRNVRVTPQDDSIARLHRGAGTMTPGIEARIRRLNEVNRFRMDGEPFDEPTRIEHNADQAEAPSPSPPLPPARQPCDRGYDVALGVDDDDDGTACAPVPRAHARKHVSQLDPALQMTSPAVATRAPIYLMPPQISDVQRKLTMYAAGVELPGKATDWLKGLGVCVAIWLSMRWAMASRTRAALFILGAPLAIALLFYNFW